MKSTISDPTFLAPATASGGESEVPHEGVSEAPHRQDVELMTRVAEGNLEAQRQVATRLAARAHRIVHALVRHDADAKDIVQDSLLEVLNSAGTYRGKSAIEPWADRIIVRTSIRALRKGRKVSSRIEDEVDPDDLMQAPPESAVGEAISRPMNEYVARLSEPLRSVLLLRYGFGYTIPEVSALEGVSENTLKKRLIRANQLLRQMVAADAAAGARWRRI